MFVSAIVLTVCDKAVLLQVQESKLASKLKQAEETHHSLIAEHASQQQV